MNKLLTLLTFILSHSFFAQDTIYSNNMGRYGSQHFIAQGADTFTIYTYPDNKVDSRIAYSSSGSPCLYEKYYPSGKTLWKGTLIKNQLNGPLDLYSEKGKRLATLFFENDSIRDTLIYSEKYALIFGKMTYSSTVYGGMVNEDGTSNISHSEGPQSYQQYYTVKLDSTLQIQEKYCDFRTDPNGFYFVAVSEGDYGFFPEYFDIKNVNHTMGTTQEGHSMSGHDGWSTNDPISIQLGKFVRHDLHRVSVGYAP